MAQLIHRWPPANPPTEEGESSILGVAPIIARVTADAALISGMINGTNTVAGGPNPCVNFQGDWGHDHSGGYYGKAIYRSMYSDWHGSEYTSHADIEGGAFQYQGISVGLPAGTARSPVLGEPTIWVQNCDPDPDEGAYHKLNGVITVDATFGNIQAGDDIDGKVWNKTMDAGVTCTSVSTTTGKDHWYFSDLPLLPGALNELKVFVNIATDGTAASRLVSIEMIAFECGIGA